MCIPRRVNKFYWKIQRKSRPDRLSCHGASGGNSTQYGFPAVWLFCINCWLFCINRGANVFHCRARWSLPLLLGSKMFSFHHQNLIAMTSNVSVLFLVTIIPRHIPSRGRVGLLFFVAIVHWQLFSGHIPWWVGAAHHSITLIRSWILSPPNLRSPPTQPPAHIFSIWSYTYTYHCHPKPQNPKTPKPRLALIWLLIPK